MRITEFFRLIGASARAAATVEEIAHAEARLGGVLPKGLRDWYLEADGFDGEARTLWWRFPSLARLHTVGQRFGVEMIEVKSPGRETRRAPGAHYAIFCDALIYLPFYATNVRAGDAHFGEVIVSDEEEPDKAWLAADAFDQFEAELFTHYGEAFISAIPDAPH
jgi:hypothetical protein